MAKVKHTKNELKRQKDNLKRFERYLPTLELKKKQLLQVIHRITREIEDIKTAFDKLNKEVNQWVDIFAQDVNIGELIEIEEIIEKKDNVAGIDIPVFENLIFEDVEYDLFSTPFWIDKGIEVCKKQIERRSKIHVLKKQRQILQDELRTTIQRIKLFEEIKIPEANENIRKIRIFLGDQQTAEVVRGKIAKSKIERKKKQAEYI
ncbi:MAG: V-type ATP synthase subunit D [bacterium]